MAGRSYEGANECDRAIQHYQAYLTYDSTLSDLIQTWIGDCHASDGRHPDAIGAYRQALEATEDTSTQVGLREKIAKAYMTIKEYEASVAEYDAILEVAQIGDYRAKIEYMAGQALAAAGQSDAAFARYQRAVDNYPEAEYAYFSLVELVYGGAEVDEFQRGLIDYYAGATYPDAYGASIRAFDRYLSSETPERSAEALYYKALGQRAIGQLGDALATLEQTLTGYPDSEIAAQALYEKGATSALAGDSDMAVSTYQAVADKFPKSDLAPEALWRGARLCREQGTYATAAEIYERLQADFPDTGDPDAALWYAGLARYRANEMDQAIGNWQTLLAIYPESIYAPKTRYWLGKAGAEPEEADIAGYWEQLEQEIPNTYYALRIAQLESGEPLTVTRWISAPLEPYPWDGTAFEQEVLTWLREWVDVPGGTASLSLPPEVAHSADFLRGQTLLEVTLRPMALEIFERVQGSAQDDPLALAALGRFFYERGLYGLAAGSAERVADLWPEGSIHDAPLPLRTMASPLAFTDLLSAEAESQDLDPLLLAALIRQESLFEPAATSWVGARGLAQVMPATGQSIAEELGFKDFEVDELYRPWISIRFGAYYLAAQLQRFDHQLPVALAAYNGGPGNALQWLEDAGSDLDLFVEVITAVQSRLYLQGIYEQYEIYKQLYRPDEPL
jgi:soluble lytic murein transglycosylase